MDSDKERILIVSSKSNIESDTSLIPPQAVPPAQVARLSQLVVGYFVPLVVVVVALTVPVVVTVPVPAKFNRIT